MLKKNRRRLWLMAKRRPAQRRVASRQIVRIRRIAFQNLLKLVVHPVGRRRARVGYRSGSQQDFREIIVIQLEAVV